MRETERNKRKRIMLRGSLTCREEQIHWTLDDLLQCLAYVLDAIRADYTLILILLQRCRAAAVVFNYQNVVYNSECLASIILAEQCRRPFLTFLHRGTAYTRMRTATIRGATTIAGQ